MEQSIVLEEGHYQLALPWKNCPQKITEKPSAFLKVFLIHGQRGEKWLCQEGSTIRAKPAHRCGVVSASSSSSQPQQVRQGPCCV